MKRVFRVSIKETWLQHFLVEAETAAQAVHQVKHGAPPSLRAGQLVVPDGMDYLGAGAATARVVRQADGRPAAREQVHRTPRRKPALTGLTSNSR